MLTKATFLLLAACAVSVAIVGGSEWNQATRNQILEIHNEYRRNEGGCQINKLEYDMALEAQARTWAEGCWFKHEMVKGRGENLAYSTWQHPEQQLITDAAAGWFKEKEDFSRGQYGCQRSCHYTQLVWHSTQKVGCWSTRCPRLRGSTARNAWYFVCFYTPMGNMIGEEPYKLHCDTPCHPGQSHEGGLCVGEAVVPCTNGSPSCDSWARRGECQRNPNYMLTNCRKACHVCK
ncbi:cysteine-rich venom protein [Elysia marginata]|uniref:Cysteine-rich venom protein n=1 Tax=Elysia marginata TaxID=1093978 RepID=A0AAV4GSZ4_9GAST|nr:cysteine-rich venom protein [Elysia marginata]